MRELTALEVSQVGGGTSLSEYAEQGGIIGTIVGAIVTHTLYGAARGGMLGALLGATGGAAYEITSWGLDQIS